MMQCVVYATICVYKLNVTALMFFLALGHLSLLSFGVLPCSILVYYVVMYDILCTLLLV